LVYRDGNRKKLIFNLPVRNIERNGTTGTAAGIKIKARSEKGGTMWKCCKAG
jgi:hypothetical protein